MSKAKRELISEKLLDWANLIFGALILSRVFSGNFDWLVAAFGLCFWLSVYTLIYCFLLK